MMYHKALRAVLLYSSLRKGPQTRQIHLLFLIATFVMLLLRAQEAAPWSLGFANKPLESLLSSTLELLQSGEVVVFKGKETTRETSRKTYEWHELGWGIWFWILCIVKTNKLQDIVNVTISECKATLQHNVCITY